MPHTFAFTDSVAAVAPPFIEIQMIINSTVSSTGLRFLFLILLLSSVFRSRLALISYLAKYYFPTTKYALPVQVMACERGRGPGWPAARAGRLSLRNSARGFDGNRNQ